MPNPSEPLRLEVESVVDAIEERDDMTVKRIDNVLIVVDDLEAVKAFFVDLIGEMEYGDNYRLAYLRGPEGIIVALAEQKS